MCEAYGVEKEEQYKNERRMETYYHYGLSVDKEYEVDNDLRSNFAGDSNFTD